MWNFRGQNILWTILHKEGAGWRPLNDPWSKPLLPLRPFPFPPSPSFTSHLSLFYPSCFPSIPFFPPSLFPLLPLVQLGGLGSAVGSSSGVRGGALAANTSKTIVTPENTSGDHRFSNPTCILAWYRADQPMRKFFAGWGEQVPLTSRMGGHSRIGSLGSASGNVIFSCIQNGVLIWLTGEGSKLACYLSCCLSLPSVWRASIRGIL